MSDSISNPDAPDKDYEATFDVLMPGNAKATSYKITVQASEPIEAMAKAIDEWKKRTEPSDVRVKEIKEGKSGKVQVAS